MGVAGNDSADYLAKKALLSSKPIKCNTLHEKLKNVKINIERKYQNNIREILNKSYSNIKEIVKSVKNALKKKSCLLFSD